jgi:hypothetical protein
LCILTEPIVIKRGGILNTHEKHRPTDDDCMAIWLPLDEKFGGKGAESLHNMFKSIDDVWEEKLGEPGYFVVKKGKDETPLKKLLYTPFVRQAPIPPGANDFIVWNRTKIRIPYTEVKGEDNVTHKSIDVKLIVPGDDGKPVKKVATSITDLRKDFAYGCTAQFYLEVKTFWILKTPKGNGKNAAHECGFKVTCKMINILEKSKLAPKGDYDWDDLLGDDEDAKPTSNLNVKNSEKTKSDDDDKTVSKSNTKNSEKNKKHDSDNDDDDNNAKNKKSNKKDSPKTLKKGKKNDSDESDASDKSDSESESDDDKKKKQVKGGSSNKKK